MEHLRIKAGRFNVIVCLIWFCVPCYASHLGPPWRETREYPKELDHFQLYVTNTTQPMTGERALSDDGCGAVGRPYKYRGVGHVPEIRQVLREAAVRKVWVGAVQTTTPWTWTDGQLLFRPLGLAKSQNRATNVFRILGNNAFLCSLECDSSAYSLLQGNKCTCTQTEPALLPVGNVNIRRCPGTYQEECGTVEAFSVYENTLRNSSVPWASLLERARRYGTKAFLYKSIKTRALELMAEDDARATKGYICSGTFQTIDNNHTKHLWVAQELDQRLAWQKARQECKSQGKTLLVPSPDAQLCIPEVDEDLKLGKSYWVGLYRRNASVWLDGTPVELSFSYSDYGKSACLTLTMTSTGPIFTFESCSGAMNPVLCEKDTDVHVSTFTHDAQGNHIAREVADVNDYSMTVAVLISALVILTLLSVILGVFLWNRNAWIPRKSWPLQPSGEHSCTGVPDPNAESVKCLTCKASAKTKINFFNSPKTSRKMSNREKKNEGNVQATPEAPFDTKVAPYCDVNASYAVVNKSGKRNATNTAANAHRPPTIGSDSDPHTCPSTSGLSASGSVVEYTEVVLSDFPDSVGWRSEGGEAEAVPDSPSGQGRKGMVLTTEDKRAMLMTHAGGNERLFRSRRDNDDLIAPFSRPDDFGRVDQTLSTSPFGPFSVRTTSHTTREDAQGVSREGRRGLLQPTVKIVNSTRYASSAQSSTTGSDDAYSVLNYRQQVNRAWLGLQRSRAYSHVILGDEAADPSNDPSCRGLPLRRHSSLDHYDAYPVATVMKIGAGMREADMCHVHDDDVTGEVYDVSEGVYDLARFLKLPQRPHCIDNDYDHAQPFCFPVEMPKGTAAVTSPMTQQSSWPLTSQSMPNTPSQKARRLSYRPYSYTVPHGKTLSQTFNTRAMSLTRNESEV